jgi:hypothetical protein
MMMKLLTSTSTLTLCVAAVCTVPENDVVPLVF